MLKTKSEGSRVKADPANAKTKAPACTLQWFIENGYIVPYDLEKTRTIATLRQEYENKGNARLPYTLLHGTHRGKGTGKLWDFFIVTRSQDWKTSVVRIDDWREFASPSTAANDRSINKQTNRMSGFVFLKLPTGKSLTQTKLEHMGGGEYTRCKKRKEPPSEPPSEPSPPPEPQKPVPTDDKGRPLHVAMKDHMELDIFFSGAGFSHQEVKLLCDCLSDHMITLGRLKTMDNQAIANLGLPPDWIIRIACAFLKGHIPLSTPKSVPGNCLVNVKNNTLLACIRRICVQ